MLCDDYLAHQHKQGEMFSDPQFLRAMQAYYPGAMDTSMAAGLGDRCAAQIRLLDVAQRFVLSPHVVEAAHDLAESAKAVESSRDYLFTPAAVTWLEWPDDSKILGPSNRFGLLMIGKGDGNVKFHIGEAWAVFDAQKDDGSRIIGAIPLEYDFPGEGPIIRYPLLDMKLDMKNPALAPMGIDDKMAESVEAVDSMKLGAFITAAIALINTPRISLVNPHDNSKLNKARMKRGTPPLLSWSEVVIRPDSGWTSQSEERRQTGEKRRHHVRTFLRLKKGKVEMVGAHWRGNRDKGYVKQRHIVRMTDEEAGSWKGEPLPASVILPPGTILDED